MDFQFIQNFETSGDVFDSKGLQVRSSVIADDDLGTNPDRLSGSQCLFELV